MNHRHPILAALLLAFLCASAASLSARQAAAAPAGDLAADLALPFASELTGARDAPVFAWVSNTAGVRNIWIDGRQRTGYGADDGMEVSGLALSPAGDRLLFVRGGDAEFPDGGLPNTGNLPETPEQLLYVMDTAGNAPPERIGAGHDGLFSPDAKRVAFTRRGEIWLWDGAARRIAAVRGAVGDMQWSPDGGTLLFRESRGDHSVIGLIDVAGGEIRYPGATLGHSTDPVFSPDGRSIAFIQFRDPPAGLAGSDASFWSIRVSDIASGETRTLWTAPAGEGGRYYGTRARNLFWTAGGMLLFPWERSGWLHIYTLPAAGGNPRDLTPHANEVENFTPTPDGRAIVYTANAGNLDTRQIWRSDIAGGGATRLTKDDSQFLYRPLFGGGRLAAIATDATHIAHPVLVEGMKPMGPTPVAGNFVKPETIVFTAEDGMKLHGQLFPAKGAGPHPALVFVHGGPRRQMLPAFHPMHYYSNAYVLNQRFAAQGYTVLSVNYRSGTSYGRAFREAPGKGRDGGAEYRDVRAAGRWLAARKDVDPARIGVWGGSWGGYLTAMALARDSDLFAAGADFHGVHTLVRAPERGLSPEAETKARQLQWESSPMSSMDRWKSPVLLVHGDDDRNVDYFQSLLLARELQARAIPFEELSFTNERHEFFRWNDWLSAYRATEDFFARRLMKQAR